ncbi:hypothetical protein HDU67_002908, partial [Dinochytrium kinnereticum]
MAVQVDGKPAALRADLLRWFEAESIAFDADLLDVRCDRTASFSVHAKKSIATGMTVATIPKSAVLSVRNCGIADRLDEDGLGGTMALAIALMFEIGKGKESPWFGYLASLPRHVHLPIFWTDEERRFLVGTDLEHQVEDKKSGMEDDFDEHVLPFIMANLDCFAWFNPDTPSKLILDQFLHCMSLVASRGFEVDAYHGHSMVPFADLFNHRTAAEHVHFESDHDVCVYCGAHPEHCTCREEDDDVIEEEEEEEEDPMEEDSLKDVAKGHNPYDLQSKRSKESKDDYASDDGDVEEVEDSLEMITVRPVRAGEEVYNTYGTLMSETLLSRYGFCDPPIKSHLPSNPFDCVRLGGYKFMHCVEDAMRPLFGDATEEVLEEREEFWKVRGRGFVCNVVKDILGADEEEGDGEEDLDEDDKTEEEGNAGERWEDLGDGSDVESDEEHMDEEHRKKLELDGSESESSFDEMDQDSNSASSEDQDSENDAVFHLTPHGLPSPHLYIFLHLCFISKRLFRRLAMNEDALTFFIHQHIQPLLAYTESHPDVSEAGALEPVSTGWVALNSGGSGTARATRSMIGRRVDAVLDRV